MTEELNSKKGTVKKTAVAGGGLLGVGALAFLALGTGANWSDSEAVGADFSTGNFNLQVNTGNGWQDVEAPSIEQGSDGDDELILASAAELGFEDVAWGPGEERSASFQVRLDEETTHDADLDFSVTAGDAFTGNYTVDHNASDGPLATGDIQEIEVVVSSDSDNFEQDTTAAFYITVDAESTPNL